MIDHGFVFNGPHWELPESAILGLYPRRVVYQNVTSLANFEPWLSRVLNFPDDVLDRALRRLPPEWIREDVGPLEKLLEALMRRRKRILELIECCRDAPWNPFPRWVS